MNKLISCWLYKLLVAADCIEPSFQYSELDLNFVFQSESLFQSCRRKKHQHMLPYSPLGQDFAFISTVDSTAVRYFSC